MTYLSCKDLSIFGSKKPVVIYGMFIHLPIKEYMRVHYCIWGKPYVYKTIKYEGKKVDLHKEDLLPEFITITRNEFEKHFTQL